MIGISVSEGIGEVEMKDGEMDLIFVMCWQANSIYGKMQYIKRKECK